MTRRQSVLTAALLIILGLAVAAVGVHMLAGTPVGLIADGVALMLAGALVASIWA